eukprot:PhM_4_TR3452/c3_g1_i3/m.62868
MEERTLRPSVAHALAQEVRAVVHAQPRVGVGVPLVAAHSAQDVVRRHLGAELALVGVVHTCRAPGGVARDVGGVRGRVDGRRLQRRAGDHVHVGALAAVGARLARLPHAQLREHVRGRRGGGGHDRGRLHAHDARHADVVDMGDVPSRQERRRRRRRRGGQTSSCCAGAAGIVRVARARRAAPHWGLRGGSRGARPRGAAAAAERGAVQVLLVLVRGAQTDGAHYDGHGHRSGGGLLLLSAVHGHRRGQRGLAGRRRRGVVERTPSEGDALRRLLRLEAAEARRRRRSAGRLGLRVLKEGRE